MLCLPLVSPLSSNNPSSLHLYNILKTYTNYVRFYLHHTFSLYFHVESTTLFLFPFTKVIKTYSQHWFCLEAPPWLPPIGYCLSLGVLCIHPQMNLIQAVHLSQYTYLSTSTLYLNSFHFIFSIYCSYILHIHIILYYIYHSLFNIFSILFLLFSNY